MRFNPTTQTTMMDWLVDVVPRDPRRKPFRKAMSAHLSEGRVYELVMSQLSYRRVGLCDIEIKRRKDDRPFRRPTDERVLRRYVEI